MLVTKEVLDRLFARTGGWQRWIVMELGVGWPLQSGWKEKLLKRNKVLRPDQVALLGLSEKPRKKSPLEKRIDDLETTVSLLKENLIRMKVLLFATCDKIDMDYTDEA